MVRTHILNLDSTELLSVRLQPLYLFRGIKQLYGLDNSINSCSMPTIGKLFKVLKMKRKGLLLADILQLRKETVLISVSLKSFSLLKLSLKKASLFVSFCRFFDNERYCRSHKTYQAYYRPWFRDGKKRLYIRSCTK